MECREACRAMSDFLDGEYPVERQEELLWHFKNCSACQKELEISLSLQLALNALDDNTDFICTDSEEGMRELLENAEIRVENYNQYRCLKWAIRTVTGWALFLHTVRSLTVVLRHSR